MTILPLTVILIFFTATILSLSSTQTLKPYTIINPKLQPTTFTSSKKYERSSNLVKLKYHMGPVLSSPINIYIIWYGKWTPPQKQTIKDFILSISNHNLKTPSVSQWWKNVTYYNDQTNRNISDNISIVGEYSNFKYTHGTRLTRLDIQDVISSSVYLAPFQVNNKNGVYLVLTSSDVTVQDFCWAVCGFHYFTFPSKVGYTLPYAWVGNSGKQCPEVRAYPFAVPEYMGSCGSGKLGPPNGDVGIDGMVSVIGHELAELASNPLVNAWYVGEEPIAPIEIGDLCEGLYGSGGGGGYIGSVMKDGTGRTFNMNGINGRKFLVQWLWSDVIKACYGPNALD